MGPAVVGHFQRMMMRTALGLSNGPVACRNRFNSATGADAVLREWADLINRGLAVQRESGSYAVTRAGFASVVCPGESFNADVFNGVES